MYKVEWIHIYIYIDDRDKLNQMVRERCLSVYLDVIRKKIQVEWNIQLHDGILVLYWIEKETKVKTTPYQRKQIDKVYYEVNQCKSEV